jgi:tetratricopeptide (TPR) repeat protein
VTPPRRLPLACLAVLLFESIAASRVAWANDCAQPSGRVTSLQGAVEIRSRSESNWRAARADATICPGDVLRVRGSGRAAVMLDNEITLRLDQRTTLTISDTTAGKPTTLDLLEGALHVITRYRGRFRVITPFLNASVDGTEFFVESAADRGTVGVLEGHVTVANDLGDVTLRPGQSAVGSRVAAPRLDLAIVPKDAVRWTLHFQDVLDWQGLVRRVGGDVPTTASTDGNLSANDALLRRLEDASDTQLDADASIVRAALLLRVGQAHRASRDIARALALDPGAADAYALRSAMRVASGDSDGARTDAQRAVELAPDRAPGLLALSYAEQSRFRLAAARQAAQRAVSADPASALAWARLAELDLSSGDRRASLESAQRAVSADASMSRAHSVLGYAELARLDATAAADAFRRAIALDSADPLPRLGLGLATVHRGQLAAGREQIEIAVSLDPGSSILRSYLGKAYYEEKRDTLAERQFDLARDLDTRDPTPWLYAGLLAQTANRPVDALIDMGRAIALNDDRIPYRSRLLLDRDQADRGAGLARIYSELGFDQLAFVQGATAVQTDPTSAQAHRFLADTYAVQPRGEIASASELLQSQLLETGHVEPVQPTLGDDRPIGSGFTLKTGILRVFGPSQAGYNEYNPLYKRDGLSGSVDIFGGDRGTAGDQVVVNGGSGANSFSAGHQHFESHGILDGQGQRGDVLDALIQSHVTEATTVQAEIRNASVRRDQIALGFSPDSASPFSTDETVNNVRLGIRQRLGPDADLLIAGSYQTRHVATDVPPIATIDEHHRDSGGEVQYIGRWSAFRLIVGGSHVDRSDDLAQSVQTPSGPFADDVRFHYTHENGYVYGNASAWDGRVLLDVGLGADVLKSDGLPWRKTSTKAGLTLKPLDGTTVRLAAFDSLHRPSIANQTLEPTQIAGFNRLYDDPTLSYSHLTGVAIDQRLAHGVYAGVQIANRRSVLPSLVSAQEFEWRDRSGRAYLDWAVPPELSKAWGTDWQFAVGIDWDYERVLHNYLDNAADPVPYTLFLPDGIVRLNTRAIPLRLGAFAPAGWSISLTVTRVDQSAMLVDPGTYAEFDPSVSAWVTDLAARYRLPGHRGFLAFGVSNLFDRPLILQEIDTVNPRFAPHRLAFVRATLTF